MTQPQALTTQQIQNYQNQIQNAGTLAQKKAAAIAVYQDLYAKGYNYAGWALGVATGNTVTGTAALDYLTGTALMGLGNTEVCRNLTPAQVDKIRVDMAWNTMEQMRLEANRTGGVLTQDLKYDRVEAAHETTFRANGLSLDNWTLNTPMTLYRQAYGNAAADALWVKIRETGGDGLDGVMASTLLVTAMGKLAFESNDPNVRQQALAWMDQVPGTANPQALWRSSKLVGKWLGADVESIGNFSTPGVADAPAQVAQDQELITGVSNYLKSQTVSNDPAPSGLDTPSRNSAALINTTGAHTTQFNSGGGVDDLWVVEKNAGRYSGTRDQFRADFVASNANVDADTLGVQQGQNYYVPQRSANGNTVYHYSNGATVMNNTTTGEYHMVVPNTDGSGGQTVYSRSADDVGYTVKQVTTNAAGTVVFEHQSYQNTLDADLSPVSTNSISGNQTTTRNWLTDNVFQTDTFVGPPAPNQSPSTSSLNFGSVSYNLFDAAQNNDASYKMWSFNQNNGLSNNAYNSFTQQSSNFVVDYSLGGTGSSNWGQFSPPSNFDFFPIGAFYDSQSAAFDNAASIANKTTRAMNDNGQALTANQLAALDTNSDGQISTAEASGARLWADLNENGTLDNAELQSVGSAIQSADYGFYTQGNGNTAASGASGTAAPGVISVSAAGNACNDMKYRCAA